MANEIKTHIEIVEKDDMRTELAEKYHFTVSQIDRYVLGRVNGDSWDKISRNEQIGKEITENYTEDDLRMETSVVFKALAANEGFKALVAKKREEYDIMEISMEEQELIDKLKSIIKGEAQGKKLVKVTNRVFNNGEMEIVEE